MQLKQGCRLWWLAVLAAAIDRLSKAAVLQGLSRPITAIPGVLSCDFVKNSGAAFGMLAGSWLLPLITIALMAVLLIWLIRHTEMPRLMRIGLWLIIGGGLGNLYDRIAYGYVIDFIRLDFIHFPVFNVADIFVCVGVGLVLLSAFISERRPADG